VNWAGAGGVYMHPHPALWMCGGMRGGMAVWWDVGWLCGGLFVYSLLELLLLAIVPVSLPLSASLLPS